MQDLLDDLALLISRVEASVKDRAYEDFTRNSEAYDALTYRLAMIGETCGKFPHDIIARHPEVLWREMMGFRNYVSHDYFGVDGHLVWAAAMSLEPVKAMMQQELQRLERERDSSRER